MNHLHPKFILFIACSFFLTVAAKAQPGNNSIGSATLIVTDSTCDASTSLRTNQTLSGATYLAADIGSTASACTWVPSQDVWYKFVAKSTSPTISVYNLGSSWGSSLKLSLYSGSAGSLTSRLCANNNPVTPLPTDYNLAIGTTYYVRVHKDNTTAPTGSNWGFDICITDNAAKVSRMNEVFSRTYLSGAGVLNYPWEVTYGADDSLWITEAKGYKVYKMSSADGGKRTVLDLNSGSTWLASPLDSLNAQQVVSTWNPSPQGGLAGLALHPQFGTGAGKDWVYITYVWNFVSNTNQNGVIYQNKLVRFTYVNGRLTNPAVIEARLPGSSDHNSQRLIVAPIAKNGTPYLFMGQGDMGAGQFYNRYRVENAQDSTSPEGKVLRYNLDTTGMPGTGAAKWLPVTNPFASNRAIYSIGLRNSQGFAYDTSTNILYGSSHGPYSDDEINIIDKFKNYGHPLVIGYAADGNYNGASLRGTDSSFTAGAPYTDGSGATWYYPSGYTPSGAQYSSPYTGQSSLPPIGNEITNKNTLNTNALKTGAYQDPLFSAYPSTRATIKTNWQTNPGNGGWESEGWSGLDLYSNTIIPGWNRSLVAAGLKWGRLVRLELGATGTTTMPSNIGGAAGNINDTITYFQSSNRYRDLAFAPNGKDLFVIMDNSSATSGPGTANPSAAGCPGCVVKYSFLGYADNGATVGLSTISKSIDVTTGAANSCIQGTPVTIDASNNNLWVPITGPDGNIMAELNAMGQNMGLITTSYYRNGGAIRTASGVKYLDRNITIKPAITSYATPVKVRLYISKAEVDALIAAGGVTDINALRIHKNNDNCSPMMSAATTILTPTNPALADLQQGPNGYVLQTAVSSFSTFYFAKNAIVLPTDNLSFTGALQSDLSALLNWKTETEINVNGFDLERSTNGTKFTKITFVNAKGNGSAGSIDYAYTDKDAMDQQSTVLYYRLKVINTDGSFKYSEIVKLNIPVGQAIISIAPNPVLNTVKGTIVSPVAGNVTLRIFDNNGRLVSQTNSMVKKGSNNFTININQLASGAYYLDISGNGISSRSKFQKL